MQDLAAADAAAARGSEHRDFLDATGIPFYRTRQGKLEGPAHNETKGCLLFTTPLGLNTLVPNGRNARTSSIRVTCKRRLFTPLGTGPVER